MSETINPGITMLYILLDLLILFDLFEPTGNPPGTNPPGIHRIAQMCVNVRFLIYFNPPSPTPGPTGNPPATHTIKSLK